MKHEMLNERVTEQLLAELFAPGPHLSVGEEEALIQAICGRTTRDVKRLEKVDNKPLRTAV